MTAYVIGICELADCPVVDGGGACILGKAAVHCNHFEPAIESAAHELSEGHIGPADPMHGPTMAAPDPEPDPAVAADEVPLVEDSDEPSTRAPGKNVKPASGREPMKVPQPGGPRRLVELAAEDSVPLASGLALNSREAREVLSSEAATPIVLAGPPESGKTTLLAVLYESFCVGPIGHWTFAGSLTLFAFMQRAWYASSASRREAADTDRTRMGLERPWLHLRVGRDGEHRGTLLLADLSGEYFRDIASGAGLGDATPLVARARHVVHLVDAGLYEAPRERQRAHDATSTRIRRLAEGDAFASDALHTVVISKSDLCPDEYTGELIDGVKAAATRWLPSAPVVSLAARPRSDSPPSGLSDLLDALMRTVAAPAPDPPPSVLRPTVARLARAAVRAEPDDENAVVKEVPQ